MSAAEPSGAESTRRRKMRSRSRSKRYRHSKSFYARRLLFRLGRQGWVCISASYRLQLAAAFSDELIDVKKVIAWARAHACDHGCDPDRIVLTEARSARASRRLRASPPTTPPSSPDSSTPTRPWQR